MDAASIYSMISGVGKSFTDAYDSAQAPAILDGLFKARTGSDGAPGPASGFAGVGSAYRADAGSSEPKQPTFVGLSGAEPSSARKMSGTNADFANAMMPHAIEASRATGVDPRIIVAQSAIETGWGRSAPGNNYFGIKSHSQGGGNQLATTEVVNGQPVRVTDSFRAFPSMADSVAGYRDFINANPRYAGLKGAQGLEAQATALQRSGYATDPNYGSKVLSVAKSLPEPDAANLPAQGAVPVGFSIPGQSEPAAQSFPGVGARSGGMTPEMKDAITAAWKNPHTKAIAAQMMSSLLTGKQTDWEMKDVNGQSAWVNSREGKIHYIGERKVDPTSEQRNYKEAQEGGYTGTFTDFLDSQRRSLAERDEGVKITAQIDARKAQAGGLGLVEGTPAWQSFVGTGKIGRDQDLSATDKKAILEAEESVLSAQTAIDSLKQAKTVSPKAYEGPTAGLRGYGMSLIGSEAGEATQELTNIVTTNALGQMKAIFGGNPTEGERKILLDIQGSVGQPDAVRQKIFDRAIALAERRLEFNRRRAEELKGGTYYKADTPAEAASGSAEPALKGTAGKPPSLPVRITPSMTPEIIAKRYPSGTKLILPDGSEGVVP